MSKAMRPRSCEVLHGCYRKKGLEGFFELNWAASPSQCVASESIRILEENGFRFSDPKRPEMLLPSGEWLRSLCDVIAAKT